MPYQWQYSTKPSILYNLALRWMHINPKETSWGLKGPVTDNSYNCAAIKNNFPLILYVFLKNIVLHYIMQEK